jgi:hypothetical protein
MEGCVASSAVEATTTFHKTRRRAEAEVGFIF